MMMSNPLDIAPQGIPVLLLTGPLGAGKTTLLNRILSSHPKPQNVALVINEIGDVAIDPALIQRPHTTNSAETDESVTMSTLANGCICCTIRSDFIESMFRLLTQLDKQKDEKVEYIIIETTGVADPEPVMNSISETDLAEALYLDQVLAVVDYPSVLSLDPKHDHKMNKLRLQEHQKETFVQITERQLRAADTVYVTKLDLEMNEKVSISCGPELSKTSEAIIRKLHPSARILLGSTLKGPFPWDLILNMKTRHAANGSSTSPFPQSTPSHHCTENCTTCTEKASPHSGINSVSYSDPCPLSLRKFRKFLDSFSASILRAKGVLLFAGYKERFVLQVSGGRFEVMQDEWPRNAERMCRIVVIGFDVEESWLSFGMKECLASGENKEKDTRKDDESEEDWE